MDSTLAPDSKKLSIRPDFETRLSYAATVRPGSSTPDSARPTMADSPLTRQEAPDVFEPKIVGLYKRLFREVEDDDKPEGFWTELFLLRPDVARLRHILEDTDAEYLIHLQHQSQQLLLQAIAAIKTNQQPLDENALETLTVFFAVVLAKKYMNPSSDIIEVLAGLDSVDSVLNALVETLDGAIKDGRTVELRQKAVQTAIAVVAGGYQTALVSYFIHRDFFPALMKLIYQLESPLRAAEPLLLTGLLSNYNKFEAANQYWTRFADFVNNEAMRAAVESVGWTSLLLRERYVAIQDDTPTAWSIGGTLSYVGLGSLAGVKPAPTALTEEQQRGLFLEQPGLEASILLPLYDFVSANKVFCNLLITAPAPGKDTATPFSTFLSFNSYLYQHAHRTSRASTYAYLTLLILLLLVEDTTLAKLLCETSAPVRLCQQRPPHLPSPKGERPYAAAIMDIVVDGLNHNLRKRLDTAFYIQSLTVLTRLLSHLAKTRTKLTHHWSELWRSLLSFVRFLTTYPDDLKLLPRTPDLITALIDLLTLALTSGESFLPDAAAYDDLFYKLVESGDALVKLRDTYALEHEKKAPHIDTLVGVSRHYQQLIASERVRKEHLTPAEVAGVIKKGYETLTLEEREGMQGQERFREVEHKAALKRVARVVVGDAGKLVMR